LTCVNIAGALKPGNGPDHGHSMRKRPGGPRTAGPDGRQRRTPASIWGKAFASHLVRIDEEPEMTTTPPAVPTPGNGGAPPPSHADAHVFRARNLTKTYRAGEVDVQALRGVDLTVARGEMVVLLGPSGSGKSTLLNILGGLDVPSGGEVWYGDHRLHGADERDLTRFRREHVGFVFQFYNLIPSLTALENVALVTEIADDPMSPRDALARLGLDARRDHFPAQLSGGEQQRVAIARAIAKRPDALLCDEPTGALDVATGVLVLEALDAVNRELGTTTLIITHNADIARMAHRVLQLADGRIAREHRNEVRTRASELSW
jgi:putative ABC transport system ATP-binding protein